MKTRTSKHRARVYFRAYSPEELAKVGAPEVEEGIEPSWREAACMEFVHDSHSSCETLTVHEESEEAVRLALQAKHPLQRLQILKINWLHNAALD